ncbi:uncharacterized protein LOC142163843 [Nicotiana tabacum]|uniref:Uncharacterized protein LOC142163843 n=1 Tax=Nicotiana tabacum TaxID=4097 RepID=A0AC58RWJ1_TOBAC
MESYLRIRDKERTSNEEHSDSSSIRGHYFAALLKDYSCDVLTKKQSAKRWRKYIPAHGLDVVGLLPKSSKGQIYIITDNGTPFKNKLVKSLCENFGFKQHKSSIYNAPANGLDEAFNKMLGSLLKKVVAKNKRDWHEKIVLPLEQQIPSLRITIQEGLTFEENAQLRLAELEALDEKRLEAQQKLECYQAGLARAFNKKVRPRSFQVGDLVPAVRRPIILNKRIGDKFTSKWDGPYVVKEAYSSGAYKIIDKNGLRVGPINEKFLKQYFP